MSLSDEQRDRLRRLLETELHRMWRSATAGGVPSSGLAAWVARRRRRIERSPTGGHRPDTEDHRPDDRDAPSRPGAGEPVNRSDDAP